MGGGGGIDAENSRLFHVYRFNFHDPDYHQRTGDPGASKLKPD